MDKSIKQFFADILGEEIKSSPVSKAETKLSAEKIQVAAKEAAAPALLAGVLPESAAKAISKIAAPSGKDLNHTYVSEIGKSPASRKKRPVR